MNRQLPSNPNFDHLRKQAKELVKSHKNQDPAVCEELRLLHELEKLSDAEILQQPFTLVRAQLALALSYGFPDWNALKKQVVGDETNTDADVLVQDIIREAHSKRASDIHFEWNDGQLEIRLRVDGRLVDSHHSVSATGQLAVIDRVKAMAKLDTAIHDVPQIGRATLDVAGTRVDLRVSLMPYVSGESIVIRLIDGSRIISFKDIQIDADKITELTDWVSRPHGLIVVCGPAGSGKSTLMYCMLQSLNPREKKILTAEEPVWHVLNGVNQMEVDVSKGLGYTAIMAEQMRQDPDVIMVGECRDAEVLRQVLTFTTTGHLVLTGLHATDAVSGLSRLKTMVDDAYMISRNLTGLVSQRLVRNICDHCKEEYTPEQWAIDSLKLDASATFFRGKGCKACKHVGYRGRSGIHELLALDDPLRSALGTDASPDELQQVAIDGGMVTLKQDGIARALRGITTIDEVLRVCG